MKVRYTGTYYAVSLIQGKIYDVIGIEDGFYRIIDEEGFDPDEDVQGYLFSPNDFEIVEGDPSEFE